MKVKRSALAVLGLGLVAGLMAGPVPTAGAAMRDTAKTGSAANAAEVVCKQGLGWVDNAGMTGLAGLTFTKPPAIAVGSESLRIGGIRASGNWYESPTDDGGGTVWRYANVLSGSSLYFARIVWAHADPTQPFASVDRVGGGWDKFTQIVTSNSREKPTGQTKMFGTLYGLRSDGVLHRWVTKAGQTGRPETYPGFASVKGMTLISATATYDTLLVNLSGGSLYTVRIPVSSPLKPVVTPIRKSTWQGFETLVADRCNGNEIALTAIDKDTDSAFLYRLGHANGLSTPIQSFGKVPHTFDNPVHFTRTGVARDVVVGD